MARTITGRLSVGAGLAFAMLVALSACDASGKFNFLPAKGDAGEGAATPDTSVRLVERDVEAPEVFQVTELGLWDGRPSLGGVWVAHPSVKTPERVIIRNQKNGKFVIGALFRRENANPGPKLQVSSDAAAALGLLAGQPATLNVTALRREEVPIAPPRAASKPAAAGKIDAKPLDEPLAAAAAAIDAADGKPAKAGNRPAPKPGAKPAAPTAAKPAAKPASGLAKPFIQIGIFSVKANAENTAASLRNIGIIPIVKKQTSRGKTFWRVLVGPASNSAERAVLMKKIKGIGFSDAYSVTN